MPMNSTLVTLVVCYTSIVAAAQDAPNPLSAGKRAPAGAVARFSTGPWATPKARSACPVLLNRQHVKVAIYTRELTSDVVRLVQKIEKLVEKEPALKWSFVFVSHENDPTPSEAAYELQNENIKRLALDENISHISIGLMERSTKSDQPTRRKRRLGFVGKDETVVMLIGPTPSGKSSFAKILYLETVKSLALSPEKTDTLVNSLTSAASEAVQELRATE